MPQGSDLLANGMRPELAVLLGNQPTSIAATGTVQATAALLITTLTEVTASVGATGVIVPATAPIGSPYFVYAKSGGSAGVVYVQSGQTLNGVTNGTFTIASGTLGLLIQTSLNNWAHL
ncbi:MAG TPA: hypothetical protein VFR24_27350 [Candidatus Angelobacter sp.]|nr:hypothetical protein [Candidatus Angelobacter sp.]